MAKELDTLLDYIVGTYAVKDELVDIDLTAPASEQGAAIEAVKRQTMAREFAAADAMRASFRSGLTEAYRLHQQGVDDLPLDDQVPVQNAQADALIRYLVSFGLAKSRTEEVAPMHYVYHMVIDWPALEAVATAAGVPLAQLTAAS